MLMWFSAELPPVVADTHTHLPASPAEGAGLVVRSARQHELPALLALEQSSFSADRISLRSFRRFLRQSPCPLYVASDADAVDTVLGYALLLLPARRRDARLYSLAVASSARGRGVGGCLMAACVAAARADGRRELRLEVAVHNRAAIRLYLHTGFHLAGRRRAYYGDGSDAVCLRRTL
jgi:ribosomal protein S18 acetylase RimI-like enzyme